MPGGCKGPALLEGAELIMLPVKEFLDEANALNRFQTSENRMASYSLDS